MLLRNIIPYFIPHQSTFVCTILLTKLCDSPALFRDMEQQPGSLPEQHPDPMRSPDHPPDPSPEHPRKSSRRVFGGRCFRKIGLEDIRRYVNFRHTENVKSDTLFLAGLGLPPAKLDPSPRA